MQNNDKNKEQSFELVDKGITLSIDTSIFPKIEINLPSADELYEISKLSESKISFKDIHVNPKSMLLSSLEEQIFKLKMKEDFFRESPTFQNHLASLYELSGNFTESSVHFRSAFSNTNSQHFRLKSLISSLHTPNASSVVEELASDENLTDTNMLLFYSLLSLKQRDIKKAETLAKRSLDADKLNFKARSVLGLIDLINGRFESAILNFKISIEDDPTSSSSYRGIATAYLALKNLEKAYLNARKAIAINPIDENGVILFADIASKIKSSTDAIIALNNFLKYDQKSTRAWERLSLIYFTTEDYNEALKALKHLASLEETSSVFNNIGVVYLKKGDVEKALQNFAYALTLCKDDVDWVPAKNLMVTLSESGEFEKAHLLFNSLPIEHALNMIGVNKEYTGLVINGQIAQNELFDHTGSGPDLTKKLLGISREVKSSSKSKDSFDLILFNSLVEKSVTQKHSIVPLLEQSLERGPVNHEAYSDIIIYLTHHYSLIEPSIEKINKITGYALQFLNSQPRIDKNSVHVLTNNLAFANLENNLIDSAEQIIPKLAPLIHVKPYPTATLGLLHFKKGRPDRASELYEEAIRLERDTSQKNRIRQKMNLELARFYLEVGDLKSAKRYAERCLKYETTTSVFEKQAQAILEKI